jgi:hypothetical protein
MFQVPFSVQRHLSVSKFSLNGTVLVLIPSTRGDSSQELSVVMIPPINFSVEKWRSYRVSNARLKKAKFLADGWWVMWLVRWP